MAQYEVKHQTDFIVVPRQDVVLTQSGTEHRVYIKVRSLAALDKIIEQCMNLKEIMSESSKDLYLRECMLEEMKDA